MGESILEKRPRPGRTSDADRASATPSGAAIAPLAPSRRRSLLGALASLPLLGIAGTGLLTLRWSRARAVTPVSPGGRTRPLVLVLGDSLSAEYGLRRGSGWVAMLAERLGKGKPPMQAFNASISGETTAGGQTRLPSLLAEHRPSLVVIELGGNDALRGLDLAVTQSNLSTMAAAAQAAGAKVLLLGMKMPPNYGRAYGERFERLYREVAAERRCALVPFFLEGVAERIELFQRDRIHPTEEAQAIMLGNVWPTLSKLL